MLKSLASACVKGFTSSLNSPPLQDRVVSSVRKGPALEVKNVFSVRREVEHQHFTSHVDNKKLLFHGSRISNWVGILSRGVLLPHIVTNKYNGSR